MHVTAVISVYVKYNYTEIYLMEPVRNILNRLLIEKIY